MTEAGHGPVTEAGPSGFPSGPLAARLPSATAQTGRHGQSMVEEDVSRIVIFGGRLSRGEWQREHASSKTKLWPWLTYP